MKTGITVLGSTGSIGRQTLEVAAAFPERLRVEALVSGGTNLQLLEQQARQWRPRVVAVADDRYWPELRHRLADLPLEVLGGIEGWEAAVALPQVEIVVCAVSGVAGLLPTIKAIDQGKRIALANKETLVAGGELVTTLASQRGVKILPVDSEHSAVFQCLQGREAEVDRIVLTASGGPFCDWTEQQLAAVTPVQALQHPNWVMGPKITVDSATMMNKGLEVIEAHWLFAVEYDQIDVVIHPQSTIHSAVVLQDGVVLAQLAAPDMRLPIQYALSWPGRWPAPWPTFRLDTAPPMTFKQPDGSRFPCLDLAYQAGRIGGTMPAVLNAANEEAVAAFLRGSLSFVGIPRVVAEAMAQHRVQDRPSLQQVLDANREAREQALKLVDRIARKV